MQYAKIFIPILIVLGGLYIFFEKDNVQKPPGVFGTVGEYFFVDRDRIDRIELTSNNDVAVLTKKSGNWFIETSLNSPAEPEMIKTLLSQITQNPVHRVLPSGEVGELSEYGLENVAKSITLYSGGELLLDLKFGDKNPDGSGFYAKKGGSGNEIIVTALPIMDSLDFEPNTFRVRSLLKIDGNSVTALKIVHSDSYWHLDKREDTGIWYIAEPEMFRAKNEKINRLISQLTSLKITKFLNERFPDDDSHGLDSSGITVEITNRIGAGKQVEKIIFGDTNVPENAIYARLASMPDEDVLVESSILNKLKLNADDLRENSLFIVDPLQIDNLEVRERGVKNLSIYQTPNDKWQLLSPRSGDVDEAALRDFFKVLLNLRPDKYISPSELEEIDPDEIGFEAYTAKIEVKQRDGSDTLEIVIGKKSLNNGYYTSVNDIDGAYFVSDKLIKKFFDATNRVKGESPN